MKTISERANEVKGQALDLIEKKLTEAISPTELKTLCECITLVGKDDDNYMKTLIDIVSKGNSFGNKQEPLAITCDSSDEKKS